MRDDPDESILGDGTRCPPVRTLVGEPVVREVVMDVIGIEQCQQNVDVE
jgi:hypothetical protein